MGGWNSNLSAGFISYPTEPTGTFVGQTYYNSTSNIAYVYNGTSWVMLSGTIGGLVYKGTWNADTNTPTLGNGGAGGDAGDYYVVSVAGSTSIDGITDWEVGDWIVNNGTVWEKVDNSEPPLSTTLAIGNITGGNDIIYSAGDNSQYEFGAFSTTFGTGALTGNQAITLPDASGIVALTSDIITLYNLNSTIGTARVATLTDTLTFTGGTAQIQTNVTGSNTVHHTVGTSALTFSTFGDLVYLTTSGSFDAFSGTYDGGGEPAWQAQVYDNVGFVENACGFVGVGTYSGTPRPYFAGYYRTGAGGFIGFEANVNGEQLYTQRLGTVFTALTAGNGILFVNSTGYMKAASFADLASSLPTVYSGNSSLTSARTITGGAFNFSILGTGDLTLTTNDALKLTSTNGGSTIDLNAVQGFRAFSSVNVTITNSTSEVNINAGTNVVVTATALQMVGDISIGATGATQQQLIFKDLGATAFDGTLQNLDLTAARTWDLPDASGTIALTTDIVVETLAQTLAAGNTTGANDISIDAGQVITFNNSSFTSDIDTVTLTDNRTIDFPDASGIVALTSDIPSVAITSNVLPRGTGTGIADGTWENVGNHIYPTTTGSNIGQNANRIGTIFMSSVIDYATSLNMESGGTQYLSLSDEGRLAMANFNGDINAGVAAENHVWNIDSNITERTGGDGFNVYQFRSTFAGVNSSNHYRTMYVVAPTGGVNPAFGRYALYGDAFFTLGAGNDRGVGAYARAAHSTTRQYGGWFEVIGQPATVQNRAVYANMSLSGGASAGSAQGGWFQVGSAIATHTGEFTGVLGFVSRAGAAIGIGTNVGGQFAALNGATNIALRVLSGQGTVVFGTTNPAASTMLTVRGTGATSATYAMQVQDSSGFRKLAVRDDGLSQFNTNSTQISGIGGVVTTRGIIAQIASAEQAIEVGYGFEFTSEPIADGIGRPAGAQFVGIKRGVFEVFELFGSKSEAYNLGTGDFNVNSVAGIFGMRATSGNQASGSVTITNSWALDTNTYNVTGVGDTATYTNFGGLNIRFDNSTRATITNMIGVKVGDPVNVTGAVVTNTYAFWAEANTLGTNNWGAYIQGADTSSYFQGDVKIGLTGSSLTSSGAVSKLIISDTYTGNSFNTTIGSEVNFNPTVNSTSFVRGGSFAIQKNGTFNGGTLLGTASYVRNNGSGSITGMYGSDGFVWNTAATTITDMFGFRARPQNQGAGTITNFGGLEVTFGQQTVGTITNHYGVLVKTPTNTGATVTNTYGIQLQSNTIGTNNYGVYQFGALTSNVFAGNVTVGTTILTPSTQFKIRGTGATSATNAIRVETSAGSPRHVRADNGQTASTIGFNAAINAAIGHLYLVSGAGITTGFSFNSYSATLASVGIGMFSDTPTGLRVVGSSTSTGIVRTGFFDNKSTAGTQHVGVYAFARNGSQYDLGVDAVVGGGSGVAPSVYAAAVRGSAASNLDTLQYGGLFAAAYNSATTVFTNDIIGIQASASGTSGAVGSTGDVVGGKFLTTGLAGTGNRIALLVPATGNNGNVVVGADTSSANQSMVEVTGDIEIIGGTEGLILEDRSTGTRYRVYVDNGTIFSEAA